MLGRLQKRHQPLYPCAPEHQLRQVSAAHTVSRDTPGSRIGQAIEDFGPAHDARLRVEAKAGLAKDFEVQCARCGIHLQKAGKKAGNVK